MTNIHSMIPPHGATQEGTERFLKKFEKKNHPDKYRHLQDLSVSALALGTYLGNYDDTTDSTYEKAVTQIIDQGCNFIDTAINYRCQRSERSIGRALRSLFDSKKLRRSEVVISTKGGFIPFDNAPAPSMHTYIHKNWIEPGIISEKEIVSSCHCLHPAFLSRQLDQSLANLGLDTIDIYYLHNPETQLPVVGGDVFYERLKQAFTFLEESVEKGKIQYYGLATWVAFREPLSVAECIPLEKAVTIAEEVGGSRHHFRAVQLPYNLAMLEAISIHSHGHQGKKYPIISAAAFKRLSVMISAPLLQSQLTHLPPAVAQRLPGTLSAAQKALQFVVSTPSVTSAMVGMKEQAHLQENLQIMKIKNWDLPTLQRICDALAKE